MSELLIGCGSSREKRICFEGMPKTWTELVTLDNNEAHKPDIVADLNNPYALAKLPDDRFDEIHAYEVLEHIGKQGDWYGFFKEFERYWRILKPGGLLCATVPGYKSLWAWGDPSHTRIINIGTLTFLSQKMYTDQVGKTAMSDFRHVYKADFDLAWAEDTDESFSFALQAIKPARR